MSRKIRIGWKERVKIPAWGLTLKALMDPGAPLSTLVVEGVEPVGRVRDETGRKRLVLRLAVPVARGKSRLKVVHAFYHRRTRLGEADGRQYVVRLPILLGRTRFEAEVALLPGLSRSQHFLHLGREALAGRFLVDPSEVYLHRVASHRADPDPFLPLPEERE